MRRVVQRVLFPVAFVLFAGGTWGVLAAEPWDDRRNSSPEYFDAVNGGECYGCHSGQGFHPMQIGLVERYSQVPVDEDVELQMRVSHISRMGHRIQDIAVVVNVSQAPGVVVLTDDFVEDLATKTAQTLAAGTKHNERFEVGPRAREVRVTLRATSEETLPQNPWVESKLSMVVRTPGGRLIESEGDALFREVHHEGEAARDLGTGRFTIEAEWESVVDQTMDVELEIVVRYARSATEFRIPAPPDTVLDRGESVVIPIPIRVTEEGGNLLDLRVESVAFFGHAHGSAPRDDGLFYRFQTLEMEGGRELVSLGSAFAPQPVAPSVDLYSLFARIVGFVALLLVPLALVTGGVFGKGSRRWLNRVTGGAKRRVLWHMAMSWLIIVIASLHFLLALLEGRFHWSKGLFWGGVGWLLLVSLGFTGYYQTRMIKRWGYGVWRHVHLWPAIGVLLFGLVHMGLDGSDLGVLRDVVPGVDRLSWP